MKALNNRDPSMVGCERRGKPLCLPWHGVFAPGNEWWVVCPGDGQTQGSAPTFVSVIVGTDRRVVGKQMEDPIKRFAQLPATTSHAEGSGDLRRFLREGKKVLISRSRRFRSSCSSMKKGRDGLG